MSTSTFTQFLSSASGLLLADCYIFVSADFHCETRRPLSCRVLGGLVGQATTRPSQRRNANSRARPLRALKYLNRLPPRSFILSLRLPGWAGWEGCGVKLASWAGWEGCGVKLASWAGWEGCGVRLASWAGWEGCGVRLAGWAGWDVV